MSKRKKTYKRVEIELLCANAGVLGKAKAKKLLAAYQRLKKKYPRSVKIRDPTEFSFPYLYKEASVFCSPNQLEKWKAILKKRGLHIDIIHKPK